MLLSFDGTLLVQILNFVVFWVLLNYLFIAPTRKAIEARQRFIAEQYAQADALAARTRDLQAQADATLDEARRTVDEAMRAAATQASDEAHAIERKASEEAAATVDPRARNGRGRTRASDREARAVRRRARPHDGAARAEHRAGGVDGLLDHHRSDLHRESHRLRAVGRRDRRSCINASARRWLAAQQEAQNKAVEDAVAERVAAEKAVAAATASNRAGEARCGAHARDRQSASCAPDRRGAQRGPGARAAHLGPRQRRARTRTLSRAPSSCSRRPWSARTSHARDIIKRDVTPAKQHELVEGLLGSLEARRA